MAVKRGLGYIIIALVLYSISYTVHNTLLTHLGITTPFDLRTVYLFQVIFSLILVVVFEMIASLATQLKDQLGFLYLGSMVIKILAFCILFRDLLFSAIALSKSDTLSLLIAISIFIIYEVVIIAKILNRTS